MSLAGGSVSSFDGLTVTTTEGHTGTTTNCFTPYNYHYYYPYFWNTEDKIAKAFKVIRMLMDEKIVKEDITVKKFIALVEKIAPCL